VDESSTTQRSKSPLPPPALNDLLTVVESVYFHPANRGIRQVDSRWCRNLLGVGEQPYERYLKASPQWQPVDLGWIQEVGMMVIRNEEGISEGLVIMPLPLDVLDRFIEVAYEGAKDGDSVMILPGEALPFYPRTPKNLRIRCPSGTARYHLFIVPG